MTNTPDQRIDDLLDTLAEKSADSDSKYGYADAYKFADEAKSALRAIVDEMMNEAIGENVPMYVDPFMGDRGISGKDNYDNNIKNEQRQRIPQILDKYFKGGKQVD